MSLITLQPCFGADRKTYAFFKKPNFSLVCTECQFHRLIWVCFFLGARTHPKEIWEDGESSQDGKDQEEMNLNISKI